MIETVRVKCPITEDNEQGFFVINKVDLTDEHVLAEVADVAEATNVVNEHSADVGSMTKAQLQAHLHELGIEFSATDNKARLLALCSAEG